MGKPSSAAAESRMTFGQSQSGVSALKGHAFKRAEKLGYETSALQFAEKLSLR